MIEIATAIWFYYNTLGVEKLSNPGFETAGGGAPDLFGTWVEYLPAGSAIADETTLVHSGGHAVKLTRTTATPNVSQSITGLTAGATYQFTCWTRGDGTNDGQVVIYDQAWAVLVNQHTGIVGTTYAQASIQFVMPAGQTTLQAVCCLGPSVNGGVAYFDDVSVKLGAPDAWHLCPDVLQDPPPTWEGGLPGNEPMDLVAGTGILTFALDNGPSNAAGLAGYYSPGHPNAPAWFMDGLPVKVVGTRQDTFVSATRFLGEMVSARPASGVFDEATVEVEAHDWMEYASVQKLGQLAIQTNKRADQALTSALLDFPRQPAAVDFDVGKETWPSVFNTDDSQKMTMASLFQKLCRNEGGGYIFLEGDGTLRFDNRHARPKTSAVSFTLDATGVVPMNELEVVWDRKAIKNRIEIKLFPARTDTTATTIIWKLQKTFPLSPGQVMILTCAYRDPATGERISATSVVNPLVSGTHIKFGSVDDGTTNDLIGSLTFPLDVGGNTTEIALTNAGGVSGYVNFIELIGKGIYTYDPMTVEAEDAASIALRGERVLPVKLEQIADLNMARNYALILRGLLHDPAQNIERVRFLANFNDAFATAAVTAEVNVRFALVEEQTGTNAEYFVCRLKYEQVGPLLWVEIVPAPAEALNYFIWDDTTLEPDGHHTHGWDHGVQAF